VIVRSSCRSLRWPRGRAEDGEHEELDRVAILDKKPEPARRLEGHLRTALRVVRSVALAHVVQEDRKKRTGGGRQLLVDLPEQGEARVGALRQLDELLIADAVSRRPVGV